jgi:hypothetical protein
MPDSEYPAWLWTILEPKDTTIKGSDTPEVQWRKERLQQRRDRKQAIRERNFMETQK